MQVVQVKIANQNRFLIRIRLSGDAVTRERKIGWCKYCINKIFPFLDSCGNYLNDMPASNRINTDYE